MKKIIIFCALTSAFINNSLFGMLLKKYHVVTAQKNSALKRVCTTKMFDLEKIILESQQENISLKQEILRLKLELAQRTTTLTDVQETKNFMSRDRDNLTFPQEKINPKE